jgi:hypothetical protein
MMGNAGTMSDLPTRIRDLFLARERERRYTLDRQRANSRDNPDIVSREEPYPPCQ